MALPENTVKLVYYNDAGDRGFGGLLGQVVSASRASITHSQYM